MTAAAAQPELTIVVMSYRAPPTLVEAVKSALDQAPAAEVIVVNSGGGNAAALLKLTGVTAKVVEHPGRLMPGGARNLGIDNASGRIVAFLADDCLAEPGWVAARLAMHAKGHAAVASALTCDAPENPVALAAHLSLFARRMPATPQDQALPYGASYDRELFTRYGKFRDDMRGGEDSEFYLRMPVEERPVWAPDVRTMHRSPKTLRAFFADQFKRGQRTANAWEAIEGNRNRRIARLVLGRLRYVLALARPNAGKHWLSVTIAMPLVVVGTLIYAYGAWRGGPPDI